MNEKISNVIKKIHICYEENCDQCEYYRIRRYYGGESKCMGNLLFDCYEELKEAEEE